MMYLFEIPGLRVHLKRLTIGSFLIVLGGLTASPVSAQAPSVIQVPGIVRDFKKDHPDFNVVPIGGHGHYAGNVAVGIGANQIPMYSGNGFRVNSEWTNKGMQNIAPHLFLSALTTPIGSLPTLDASATADTWDSSMGSYSSQLPGPVPTYAVGSPMPSLAEPSPFVINTGDAFYKMSGNGTAANTINADIHCNKFSVQGAKNSDPVGTVLVIDGNVTIFAEGDFILNKKAHIKFTAGSTLTLYVKGTFIVSQQSTINMPAEDPYRFTVYNLGTSQMEINQGSAVSGYIVSPQAPLHLAQDDQFFGKFIGTGLQQDQMSGFHWDISPWRDACANTIEDNPGTAGINSSGGITDANTFDQWYDDRLGINLSQIHTIEMVRNGTGVYEASIADFHPIDDRLYGNEGDAHNHYFTYELTADFVYNACSNQFFEFAGADDAWMFIDGQLVLDLGGVLPGTNQIVELDRLGLTDGAAYQFKFFYAQRQPFDASFDLQTNAVLQPPVLTASGTAGFD